jgi:hypothetical protein
LVKPNEIYLSGVVGNNGLLNIFAMEGKNILERDNFAGNGDIGIDLSFRNGDSLGKINVATGEMIKQIGGFSDTETIEPDDGFGADAGQGLKIIHG